MTAKPIRMTVTIARILYVMISDPGRNRYGVEIIKLTDMGSGKVYPALARLTAAGWLTRTREDSMPRLEGRPLRIWYRLTPEGLVAARAMLEEFRRLVPAQSTA